MNNGSHLYDYAWLCLMASDPQQKITCTRALRAAWLNGELDREADTEVQRIAVPGRPDHPVLVQPVQVPKRSFSTEQGRLHLVHAIAHIEFNAINLALDAVYRFRDMPDEYYDDWLQVAVEEAAHFTLLNDYLTAHDCSYGNYCAHNGLWEMALKTDHDVMVRMALVPRVLEARGLDVTPGMITKCQSTGDNELAMILETIYHDEIGHVKIGSRWFSYICDQRGIDSDTAFSDLLDQYMTDATFAGLNEEGRLKAGFSNEEIDNLTQRTKAKYVPV